jgi:hypothetical protein
MDLSGKALNLFTAALGQIDGDHVLVSWLDGQYNSPIILRGMPHPSADIGNAAGQGSAGTHLNLKRVDGSPWFVKNNGTAFGITKSGDFSVNTCFANNGSLTNTGAEPAPSSDDSLGNVVEKLHSNAQKRTELYDMSVPTQPDLAVQEMLSSTEKLIDFVKSTAFVVVKDENGTSISLEGSADTATLALGSAEVHVAIAEHLQALWGTLISYLATHTHTTALGPSGPAIQPVSPLCDWNPAVNSGKLSIPDG